MNDIKLSNVPSMTVDDLVEALSTMYRSAIEGNLPMKNIPSVMLWGPPGVGKSQAVRQIAKRLEKSGKKVKVTDVRLLLFNPIDLRGIPTANADKTLAVWLKPQIFDMDAGKGTVNILFLDEISSAPQSVQAAAYQITLDRTVGEHKLPDNCIVIAAGNRMTDRSVVYKMPKALSNRLMHIEVQTSFASWKRWAIESGVNKKVFGFLSFKNDYLINFDATTDDLAFATPRSWEMVSNLLNDVDDDVERMFPLVAGLVGTGVAVEFRTWTTVYKDLPSIDDIFNGRSPKPPVSTDALYALTSSMVAYARAHKNDLARVANSISYADRMLPPEFSTVLLRDYMYIDDDYKRTLMKIPQFLKWLSTKGSLMNGIV